MTKVYIITAIAENVDATRGVESGQRVYAAEFHWMPCISRSFWYDTRQEVVGIIANKFSRVQTHLDSGSVRTNKNSWQILELSYEVEMNDVTPEERDSVIRANLIRRLTDEERRVLGINNVSI